MNLSQKSCPNNPTTWTDPSTNEALGCPLSVSGSAPSCETIPNPSGASTSTVIVPSSTIQLPTSCNFQFIPRVQQPGFTYSPHDGTWMGYQDDPDHTTSAPHPDGNNYADNSLDNTATFNAANGEGDGLDCQAQAQANEGTITQPNWVNIGQSTNSIATKSTGTATGDLTVPLPAAASQVRVAYSYFVYQDGSVDKSGFSDVGYTVVNGQEVPNASPQPIGSNYCSRALHWDSSTNVNGYKFCKNNAMVAQGWTPPIDFDVEPAAYLQLSAVPQSLFYQPPTANDSASITRETTQGSELQESVGSQDSTSKGESNSFGLDVGVSATIQDLFKLSVNYEGTWTNSSDATHVTASTGTNSVEVDSQQSLTVGTGNDKFLSYKFKKPPPPLQPGTPPPAGSGLAATIAWDQSAPWYWDSFELMLDSQVAAFNLNSCADGSAPQSNGGSYYDTKTSSLVAVPTCPGGALTALDGYLPYDSGKVQLVTVKELIPCADGSDPGSCTISTTPSVTLTASQAKSIISEDPFAATALGYVTPSSGPKGQAVDPGAVLATAGSAPLVGGKAFEDDTRSGALTPSQGQSTTALSTWDSSSSYSTSVNAVADNKVSVGAEFDVPLDFVSIGVSASVSFTNETSNGSSVSMTYDKSATTSNENSWLASADLENCATNCYPHNLSVYLDPRFDSLMFQVPQPAISTASITKKSQRLEPRTWWMSRTSLQARPSTAGHSTSSSAPKDRPAAVSWPNARRSTRWSRTRSDGP